MNYKIIHEDEPIVKIHSDVVVDRINQEIEEGSVLTTEEKQLVKELEAADCYCIIE